VHLLGRARLRADRPDEGLALLDEAMVGVTAGETSPRVTGLVYCSVISACHERHELRRAREWTAALAAWCAARPEFTGAFSGVCRLHRAQLLRMCGEWPAADREARAAYAQLTSGPGRIGGARAVIAGAARYQLGELHRLRGEWAAAAEAYRDAAGHGWPPQPGLALLRLAEGHPDVAAAAIRRVLAETSDRWARAALLAVQADVLLTGSGPGEASAAATELTTLAGGSGVPWLSALAAQTRGAVDLAAGRPEPALTALREAERVWRELAMPYEEACTRVLTGLACRALLDEEGAALEFAAARHIFAGLGAAPDVTRADMLLAPTAPRRPAG
jgi:hypothetical protein